MIFPRISLFYFVIIIKKTTIIIFTLCQSNSILEHAELYIMGILEFVLEIHFRASMKQNNVCIYLFLAKLI